MRVIGTAGHVDHGKSTLITALTGINPDRLKEEQEREMTIDLGFAWLDLPGGEEVGIVDVPGHRDFIENMLAGIGGIDAVLLVIAADEGVMPQTREHLAILDLLQIPTGIVVLTKIDLVDDPAWLDMIEADVRAVLRGTVLQEAPILRISSRTRAGLPELLQTLSLLLQKQPLRLDTSRPRLPVDRVFSIAGFGTVVTGTLVDGRLSVGEEVEILPGGARSRIRGLQTHKKKEASAVPGSRTAINLIGLNVEDIHRGDVVTWPGLYRPTQRLDVRFRLLADVTGPLRHAGQVKLFLGTSETIADVRLLGQEILEPGQEGWLQLELHQPVVAVRGDRYILRRPSPGETLGGGVVLDAQPHSRSKRFDKQVLARLESLTRGSPVELLLQANLALGPAEIPQVIQRARLEIPDAGEALGQLITSGSLVLLEEGEWSPTSALLVMAREAWAALKDRTLQIIKDSHRDYPLRSGMPREELKSRLKLSPRVFNALVKKLAAEQVLLEKGKLVSLPGQEIHYSPEQQRAIDALLAKFEAVPYSPPGVKDCQSEIGEGLYNSLIETGQLVPVSTEVVFKKTTYDQMVEKIRQMLTQKQTLTLAEVRDLFNTSRRYVQALLEHLDAVGVTVRDGDFRRLHK